MPASIRDALGAALLEWYRRQRRALPWRATRDPYCIWVSEVMLQQTRVEAVIGYYERWMRRFPSVEALASADLDSVLRAWEGLGYYSRARNLQRAAREVVAAHGGQLPRSIGDLKRLPGIGPYSAGAIASIAFDADEPVVDGNVMRVLTRLFALAGDPRRAPLAAQLWELARALIPPGSARDFNQALMELGATVCTPRTPRCDVCPLAGRCKARALQRVEDFPERSARPRWTEEVRAVAVLRRRGRVLVVKAPPDAVRWAGMWQFPDLLLGAAGSAEKALVESLRSRFGLNVELSKQIGSLQHQVTRFRIQLDVYA
ncbi:MAG TPA: A/G-specific adenine glycosylase, partial [Polyangiaceae bacterium]|nr:A/G-specific adenine glycosylase [Polyangiaceae bacterium]